MFARHQGPQASALAQSANTMLHLPPTVVPNTCKDLDAALTLAGTDIIAQIHANKAIFVICKLKKFVLAIT